MLLDPLRCCGAVLPPAGRCSPLRSHPPGAPLPLLPSLPSSACCLWPLPNAVLPAHPASVPDAPGSLCRGPCRRWSPGTPAQRWRWRGRRGRSCRPRWAGLSSSEHAAVGGGNKPLPLPFASRTACAPASPEARSPDRLLPAPAAAGRG
jgi:hypothetical protein